MRNHSRLVFRSIFRVKMCSPVNDLLIGYLGDVSERGFKLLSDTQMMPAALMDLRLRMRLPQGEELKIDLKGRCMWSGVNDKTGYFEAGFTLEEPSAEFSALVERLRIMRGESDRIIAKNERAITKPASYAL